MPNIRSAVTESLSQHDTEKLPPHQWSLPQSQPHTQGHRTGDWAGRAAHLQAPVLARTEQPSSLAHAEVDISFLPEVGGFLREGRLQLPCFSGKDPSRGSQEAPSYVTGFPKQIGCLGSAASRGFGKNIAPQNTCPTALSNHQAHTFHSEEAKGTRLVFMEWQRLPDGLPTHLGGSSNIWGSASVFWGSCRALQIWASREKSLPLLWNHRVVTDLLPFGVKEKMW